VAPLGATRLRDWFWRLHQGAINFEANPEREEVGTACSREIDEVLVPFFDRLEAEGDDSTIAHLLHGGMQDGGCRARDFVMPTLKVILLRGMQEPGHGAGSTLAGPLSDPGQLAAARADPGLLPAAVEEGLRWGSPLGTQTRRPTPSSPGCGSAGRRGRLFGLVGEPGRDEVRRPGSFRYLPARLGEHRIRHRAAFLRRARLLTRADQDRHPGPAPAIPRLALDPDRPPGYRGWESCAPHRLDVVLSNGCARAVAGCQDWTCTYR
jgi:hypothetical protein